MEKIIFMPDGEAPVEFFVLEQTQIAGEKYILVTDFEEGDGEALILKDITGNEEEERVYEIVSDDVELHAVADVFANLLDDIRFVDEEE